MAGTPIDISLVIACYNEEPVLANNVREIMDVLERTKYRYEIILVDDGSADATVALIKDLASKHQCVKYLIHSVNMGRGRTVTDGIRKASGSIVGYIDIDLQTPARYLPSLIREVEKGADVAVAKRVYKLSLAALHRWVLSKGYMVLSSWVLGSELRDTETGCKVFRREAILPILDEARDPHWFWDTEVMALAACRGLYCIEVPTLFIREVSGRSSVKIIRDVIHYLKNLIRFRTRIGKELRASNPRRQLFSHYRGGLWSWLYCRLRWAISPFRFMERFFPRKGTIVDAGCGEGVLATYTALASRERTVMGVDLDERRIALAKVASKGVENLKFLRGRLQEHIPLRVDGVIMSDFLHHVPLEEQKTLLNLSLEHLAEDGVLVIKEVNRSLSLAYGLSWLTDKLLYRREKVFHRSLEGLTSDLRDVGFSVRVFKRPSLLSTYVFLCQKREVYHQGGFNAQERSGLG